MDIQIETRSRSRSKTPGLRRSVEPELKEKAAPVKKDPSVSLIEEEKEEIPSTQEQKVTKKRGRKPKVVTSDYSSDEVVTSSEETISVQTTNGVEETLKETVTIETHSLFGNMFNAIKTSTPIQLIKKSSRIANKLDPEVAKAHPAYKEYKEAGEYWNKYPKTDYTYSELSPHRREIAQGVVAMPNMSRKSLEKYQGRIETMIQKNPAQESFIRQRFLSRSYTQAKYSADLQYDSADEVDVSEFSQKTVKTVMHSDSFLSKIFLFIINTFFACCYRVRSIFYRKETSLYAATPTARVAYKRGFFGKCYDFIKSIFLRVISKFYVLISSILFLDTWLLQTSAGSVENKKRKRFLLFLLLLLPILLFGAFLLSDDTESSNYFIILPVNVKNQISNVRFTVFSWLLSPFIGLYSSMKNLGGLWSSRSTNKMDMKLERSFGADELHDLYLYIDRYIDGKFQSNVENERRFLQNEFSMKIAQTINENLNKYQYQLSESDIELISERIKNQLKDDANLFVGNHQQQTVYISNILLKNRDFLTEIENVVKRATNFEGNEAISSKQEVLTASIVEKVLASDVLANLISTQVSSNNDINQLKLQLSQLKQHNHENEFNDLIDIKYKTIVDELYKFKLENDEKQGKLLNDIDVKLASFGQTHFQKIDENIKETVLSILGFGTGDNNQINDVNVKSWIQSMFVAKEHLEARLKEMVVNADMSARNEIDKNSGILMKEVNEQIQKQIVLAIRASEKERESGSGNGGFSGSLTEEDVKRIVKEILAIYDADKTGIVDYALESAGGQILSTRCTEKYQDKSGQISIFGIPIWYHSNTPRIAISPNVQPGECWAFSSFPGFLVIQLYSMVYISGFTIEHIPKSLSPDGKIDSAPANFSVWGLKAEMDEEPVLFGNYMYLDDESAPSLQYFPVLSKEINEPFQIIELRIESNHGHPKYTCLYRFRVHGKPQR